MSNIDYNISNSPKREIKIDLQFSDSMSDSEKEQAIWNYFWNDTVELKEGEGFEEVKPKQITGEQLDTE